MQPSSDEGQVKTQAIRSGKWVMLAQLLPRILTPILALLLARLLKPDDYGIVAAGTIVVSLLTSLAQVGISSALVQTSGKIEEAADTGFWLNIGLNTILFVGLFFMAPLLAGFYHEPSATWVMRLLGLQLLFSMLGSVQYALLQRQFQFRALFIAQVLPGLLSFTVSIPMALLGAGYWALVTSTLVTKILYTFILWQTSSWRPKLLFDRTLVKPLVGFSSLVVLETIGYWMLFQGDNAVVGAVLGMKALGVYSVAFNLTQLLVTLPLGAITGVTLPAFSRLQDDRDALRRAYLIGTRVIIAISLPVGVGLALISKPLVHFLYPSRWQGLEIVLPILALYAGFGSLFTLNADAFKAINRPDIIPKLLLIIVPYNLLVYWFSAPFGLVVFSIARSSDILFSAPFHTVLAIRSLGLPKNYLWDVMRGPLLGVAIMSLVVLGMYTRVDNLPILVSLLVMMATGVLTYLFALWVVDRNLIFIFIRNIKRMFYK